MAINGFNVQCNVSSISLRRLVSTVDDIMAGPRRGVAWRDGVSAATRAKEGRKEGGSVGGGSGKRKWVTKWSNCQLPTTRRANDRGSDKARNFIKFFLVARVSPAPRWSRP